MIKMVDVYFYGISQDETALHPGQMAWAVSVVVDGKEVVQYYHIEKPAKPSSPAIATYKAVLYALTQINYGKLYDQQIRFYSDNLMVIRQMSGLWILKNRGLEYGQLYAAAMTMSKILNDVAFTWIGQDAKNNAKFTIESIQKKWREEAQENLKMQLEAN